MDVTIESLTEKGSNDNASWRCRDMAEELLDQRGISTTDTAIGAAISTTSSSHFDVDTCLARIRRDKAAVVRAAFGAAATSVLHAVKCGLQESDKVNTSRPDFVLPPLIERWKKLEELRTLSLERAHDNKDARKVTSATSSNVRTNKSDASVVASTKPKSSASASKGKSTNDGASTISTAVRTPAPSTGNTQLTPNVDSRSTVSRAVLCSAASVAFDSLTPAYPGREVDVVDVPQNTSLKEADASTTYTSTDASTPTVNMGAVLLQAQTLGQRAASLAQNAALRSQQRYDYRRDNAMYDQKKNPLPSLLTNPFAWKSDGDDVDEDDEEGSLVSEPISRSVSLDPAVSLTEAWTRHCLPRLTSILHKGTGHAVYCDLEWKTRHGRVADLLRRLADDNNFGPHLIVTTRPQVERFAQQFEEASSHLRLFPASSENEALRVLTYTGSKPRRRGLRQQFADANGLPSSNFHVLVTSYEVFLQDYIHLCQVPYQMVLLDEGLLWLSAAQADPNGSLAALWGSGVWSHNDQHIGLAGTSHQSWDFCSKNLEESIIKDACFGLTARYRIITAPTMTMRHRDTLHLAPVSGLVSFLLPQFADVVREEWDRSRIVTDTESMDHVRKLVTRAVVVHSPTEGEHQQDLYKLALEVMTAKYTETKMLADDVEELPPFVSDEAFISAGKVSQSRRSALSWLGPSPQSWLRYELGSTSFQPILDAMKRSSAHGHVCEEVVTASSMTSSGAGGTVSGTQAYRLAVRCGRNFGSEQGLRQHLAALHAPPGTWLCRTCGGDCGTSQARTHHERSCGQPSGASGNHGNPAGGGVSTVGQGVRPAGGRQQNGPPSVVGKRGGDGVSGAGAVGPEDKDKDGSFRVPGYRGVWVNPAGKHFIKIEGTPLKNEKDEENKGIGDVLLFDTIEEAAQKHDKVVRKTGIGDKAELNYRPDGTRIVYEDSTAAAAAGRGLEMLGGGSSSVVPALSVINIKDLPSGVKPLLRDPRATSRTGGNSKRHVYAYRGVCRQARKGHDRWQSQISFGGTNHYLGTFDSEWDAAAIYAWAHLILYGEEATKKAQKEGEEAAAAYEQEKKDIAAGKIIVPPPKPAKKKAPKKKEKKEQKKGSTSDTAEKDRSSNKTARDGGDGKQSQGGKKRSAKGNPSAEKKAKTSAKPAVKGDNTSIAPILAKGVAKAPVLQPRKAFRLKSDDELIRLVSQRVLAARRLGYYVSDVTLPAPLEHSLRPCAPVSSSETPSGSAMLLGLSPSLFGWSVDTFVSSCDFSSIEEADAASSALGGEYEQQGFNEKFRTVIQGSLCVIGRAGKRLERASKLLCLGTVQLGGSAGEIDCNIGGVPGSCGEVAAVIQKSSSGGSEFHFTASNNTDLVTLNGQRVKEEMGGFPLFNEDVCTVGARVFVFLLPMDT